MPSLSEKNFAEDTQIIEAVSLNKDSRRKILAGVLLIVFFGAILAGMFFYMPAKLDFWFYFMVVVLAGTVISLAYGLYKALVAISNRNKLKSSGIKVKATVVGKESDVEQDPEVYLIYYQFKPDFVVKHHDETDNQSFFNLQLGQKIDVLYLEKSPRITGVSATQKSIKLPK